MTLALLLNERWEECEVDFRRYYNLSLSEAVFREGISLRELWVLVRHLPEDGAVKSAKGWTAAHELLAINAELSHALLMGVMSIGGVKNLPKPLHIPRPWGDEAPGELTERKSARPRPKGDVVVTTIGGLEQMARKMR